MRKSTQRPTTDIECKVSNSSNYDICNLSLVIDKLKSMKCNLRKTTDCSSKISWEITVSRKVATKTDRNFNNIKHLNGGGGGHGFITTQNN